MLAGGIDSDVSIDGADQPSKRGPEPDRVQGEAEWKEAVKKSLKKKKPPEGWPRGDEREDEKDVMDDDT